MRDIDCMEKNNECGAGIEKNAVMHKLENARTKMLTIVNNSIDLLINEVKNGESFINDDSFAAETIYPLGINPAMFKGTKPTAVYFGNEKYEVKTWREAFALILQRCADSPKHRDGLMHLRNKIMGRSRTFLSDKPEGMDSPVEIAEGIYVEVYLDTTCLIGF